MVPLNLLLKLVPQTQLGTLVRTMRSSEGVLKQCGSGGRKHRDAEDVCQESRPCKSGKKKRAKSCDKGGRGQESDEASKGDLQDMCSKQAALDCARRLEELQKQWEAVARAAARAEAAALQAGGSKRGSGCPVKPPAKPEKEGSSMPIVLALMAVIAGVAYYLFSQSQEGEGGEGGEGGEAEDKDKNKDK